MTGSGSTRIGDWTLENRRTWRTDDDRLLLYGSGRRWIPHGISPEDGEALREFSYDCHYCEAGEPLGLRGTVEVAASIIGSSRRIVRPTLHRVTATAAPHAFDLVRLDGRWSVDGASQYRGRNRLSEKVVKSLYGQSWPTRASALAAVERTIERLTAGRYRFPYRA